MWNPILKIIQTRRFRKVDFVIIPSVSILRILQFYSLLCRRSVRIKISFSCAAEATGEKAEHVGDFILILSVIWRC